MGGRWGVALPNARGLGGRAAPPGAADPRERAQACLHRMRTHSARARTCALSRSHARPHAGTRAPMHACPRTRPHARMRARAHLLDAAPPPDRDLGVGLRLHALLRVAARPDDEPYEVVTRVLVDGDVDLARVPFLEGGARGGAARCCLGGCAAAARRRLRWPAWGWPAGGWGGLVAASWRSGGRAEWRRGWAPVGQRFGRAGCGRVRADPRAHTLPPEPPPKQPRPPAHLRGL